MRLKRASQIEVGDILIRKETKERCKVLDTILSTDLKRDQYFLFKGFNVHKYALKNLFESQDNMLIVEN